jgi:hypothetical protein
MATNQISHAHMSIVGFYLSSDRPAALIFYSTSLAICDLTVTRSVPAIRPAQSSVRLAAPKWGRFQVEGDAEKVDLGLLNTYIVHKVLAWCLSHNFVDALVLYVLIHISSASAIRPNCD